MFLVVKLSCCPTVDGSGCGLQRGEHSMHTPLCQESFLFVAWTRRWVCRQNGRIQCCCASVYLIWLGQHVGHRPKGMQCPTPLERQYMCCHCQWWVQLGSEASAFGWVCHGLGTSVQAGPTTVLECLLCEATCGLGRLVACEVKESWGLSCVVGMWQAYQLMWPVVMCWYHMRVLCGVVIYTCSGKRCVGGHDIVTSVVLQAFVCKCTSW